MRGGYPANKKFLSYDGTATHAVLTLELSADTGIDVYFISSAKTDLTPFCSKALKAARTGRYSFIGFDIETLIERTPGSPRKHSENPRKYQVLPDQVSLDFKAAL